MLLNKCVLLYVNKSDEEKQIINENLQSVMDEKKSEETQASNDETLW